MKKTITPGDKYGFWLVLEFESKQYLKCLCTGCGKTIRKIRKWTLLRNESKSCGCQIATLMRQTNQEKYGVDYAQQDPDIKSKSKSTLQQKYGTDNAMKVGDIKHKAKIAKLLKKAKKSGGLVLGVSKLEKPDD